jgi:hypothetical protein
MPARGFVMQRGFHGRMKTLRPRRYQRQKRGIELANRAAGEPPKLQMHNQATFGDSDRLGMNRYQFPRLYHRICLIRVVAWDNCPFKYNLINPNESALRLVQRSLEIFALRVAAHSRRKWNRHT